MKKTKKDNTKIKFKTIEYTRLNNLGDFSNERITVLAEITPKQDENKAFEQIKSWVTSKLEEKSDW